MSLLTLDLSFFKIKQLRLKQILNFKRFCLRHQNEACFDDAKSIKLKIL